MSVSELQHCGHEVVGIRYAQSNLRGLYLEACLEEAGEDSEFIANALCEIAKAKHLTSLTTDIDREKHSFKVVLGLIKALGFQLKITPVGRLSPRGLE